MYCCVGRSGLYGIVRVGSNVLYRAITGMVYPSERQLQAEA
jgi:hypothetical protein